MTTLRPSASLWRRARATLIAGSIALGTVLAPAGAAIAQETGISDGTGGTAGFTWDGSTLAGATALVIAGEGGLNLRAEPSGDSAVIGSIPNGTVIALRIDETDSTLGDDGVTRWWPVAYDGDDGWVAGSWLADANGLPAGTTAFQFNGDSLTGATARVNAEAGLHLRAAPAAAAETLLTIPDNTVVDLRIDETDSTLGDDGVIRWWPVAYDGQDGWVSGFYLTSTDTDDTDDGPFEWTGDTLEGATAAADGDGQNVNVRAEPSTGAEIVTKVADGALVNLRIDRTDTVTAAGTRWWPVAVNGATGWISGDYLTHSNAGVFPAGSTALVQTQSGRGVKLRAGAGRDAEQIGSVPERSEVTILSGPASHDNSANGWFKIEHNGQRGYVDGDLLVLVSTPERSRTSGERVPADTSERASDPGDTDSSTATGTVTAEATATPTQTPTDEADATRTPTTEPQTDTTATATSEARTTATSAVTATVTPTDTAERTETEATETEAAETEAARPTQPPASSGAGYIKPVNGAIQTQGFGCSSLGFYPYNPDWGCAVHDGIDFAAPAYTPIMASAGGTVVTAGWCDCGLGYYVEIDHGGGVHTLYGHMASQPYVSVGQQVVQGQEIGPVGSTGLSTGPHTHFMVQVNGVSQDPGRYLP